MARSFEAIHIIGCPLDLGASRRGTDMGPSAIRIAGIGERLALLGYQVRDKGNVWFPEYESRDVAGQSAKFRDEILAACAALADEVEKTAREGALPVTLGGDHSVAMGSITGTSRVYERLGVVWVDAHGDFNTPESSPSGNIHGMPLAAVLRQGSLNIAEKIRPGHPLDPARTVIIGARALDEREKDNILNSGVTCFTMLEIDRDGIAEVMRRTRDRLHGCDGVHVSFDLDALDPRAAPGVGTPVRGGLTYREAHLVMETLAQEVKVVGVDLVEVNPVLDERNLTAETASELAASALGARILPSQRAK